ncbi:three-Cys-motif partner protein TcmP [Chitinophagaceae bacterium LB-8]|uniref:Three-Cys-motif partner protein TcmP n=1 Tax=Paraflavisolibacter caeni TaxID=2982496 RepID=A0A9X2XT84_9BACT|nr:three-Cys-motif partner protein TcmP [Paraflavisolibacter caeni]MCU7547906.1 three-Cys-motif partner protein TcmP [Paraflavisolibacter caeni]
MQSSFRVPQFSDLAVKDNIVVSYFSHWAKVVVPFAKKVGGKIGFLDFFSGSGKYEDGSKATPLLLLRNAAACEEMANMLVSIFCDKESKNLIKLKQSVANMECVEKLTHAPLFEKGISFDDLICNLQKIRLLPSLLAIDPFHIKDLNLELLSSYIKDGNIDCFFQIPFSLLERMIENPFKAKYLETIFGKTTADMLKTVSGRLNAQQREHFIVKTFLSGLKNLKGYHSIVLSYKQDGDVCYLIFVTRYVPRYRFMKELMIKKGYSEIVISNHESGQTEKNNVLVQAGLFG